MTTATLTIKFDGKTAERDVKRLENALNKFNTRAEASSKKMDRLSKSGKAMGRIAGGVAAVGITALAGSLVKGLKTAIDFEAGMAEISTLLTGDVKTATDELSDGIRELTILYGGDLQTNVKATYDIISAGASSSAEALATLDAASQLAIGGVTDVSTAADGLTSVMNAFGGAAGSATDISDAMFVAMKAGKTTIAELSSSIGGVAPLAAQLGVDFDDLLAATAALTKGGVTTSEAMTGLQGVLVAITKATPTAIKEANRLGIEFSTQALRAKGLAGFIKDIAEKTEGSADSQAKLFGRVEGLTKVMALGGAAAQDYADGIDAMGAKSGETAIAVDKMTDNFKHQWGVIKASFTDMTLSLGDKLVPMLKELSAVFKDIATQARNDGFFTEQGKLGAQFAENEKTLKSLREEIQTYAGKTTNFAINQTTLLGSQINNLTLKNKELALAIGVVNQEEMLANGTLKLLGPSIEAAATAEEKLAAGSKKTATALDKQSKVSKAKVKNTDELSESVLDLYDAEMDALDATHKFKTETEKEIEVLRLRSAQGELAAQQQIAWNQVQEQGIMISREQSDAFVEQAHGLQQLSDTTKNEVGQMGQIWNNFVENTQKAFGDLIYDNMKSILADGKLTFKDFTDTILDMFLSMLAQMVAKWAATKLFGGAGGGIASAFTGSSGGGGINIATGAAKAWGAAKTAYTGYSTALSGGATQMQSIAAGWKAMTGGAKAATASAKLLGPSLASANTQAALLGPTLAQSSGQAALLGPNLNAVTIAGKGAASSMSGLAGAATVAGAVAIVGILAWQGYKKAARIEKENEALTQHFNDLRVNANAFSGELVKVSENVNIVGEAEGALYIAQHGTWEQRKEEIWRYNEALDATGVSLRTIHANSQEAVTMITGTAEQLAAAAEVIKGGFDHATLSFTQFKDAGINGMNQLSAKVQGDTKKWEKYLDDALKSGELSADSSFKFIEDESGAMTLKLNGDAQMWAEYLASQGRLGANAMAESFRYIDYEGVEMYAHLSQATRDFQALMNSLTAPDLQGSVTYTTTGAPGGNPPGFATGGSFVVGGSGGTDTTPVNFMATRGEKVTVETPGQQANSEGSDEDLKELMQEMIRLLSEGNSLTAEQVSVQEDTARNIGKQASQQIAGVFL